MSFESDHDFAWVFDAFTPRGQIPGTPSQTLPHIVSDIVRPQFDALGWIRHGEMQFDTANVVNGNAINFPPVVSGQVRLYTYASIRAQGGQPAGNFWVALNDGVNSVAISPGERPDDGEASASIRRPIVVPANFRLVARSDQASGLGVTVFLEAFFIELGFGEYVLPS